MQYVYAFYTPTDDDYRHGGTAFLRGMHQDLSEMPWARSLRDRMTDDGVRGADRLGVVAFRTSGRGSLVYWVYRPGEGRGPGLFLELEPLPGHPGKMRHGHWPNFIPDWYVKDLLRPMRDTVRERQAAMAAMRAQFAEEQARDQEARGTAAKRMRKQMGNHAVAPKLMADGLMSVGHVDDETVYEMTDMLRRGPTMG